ncbi:MAG: hypothetical protein ACLFQ4_00005 [Halanaerobium sp.]
MIYDSLLGGLIGSIITIIATKIFDMIKMNFEHKNNLKRIYFEKKINAAELAVAKFYSISSNIKGMSTLFEIASENNLEFLDSQIFQHSFKNLSEEISKLDDVTNSLTNSIFLYIDIDDNSAKKLKELINLFAKLKSLREMIFINNKDLLEKGELSTEEKQRLNKYLENYKLTLNKIINTFDDIQNQFDLMLKNIRSEYEDYM